MRKAYNDLKKKHQALPPELKKADSSKNADNLEEVIQKHMQGQKRLYRLRINKTTVIYVTKKKCNEAYAEEYREKHGLASIIKPETGKQQSEKKKLYSVDHNEIIRLFHDGVSAQDIAMRLGCTKGTVKNHLKQYRDSLR